MKRMRRISLLLFLCIAMTGCGKHEYREGIEKLEAGQYKDAIEQFENAIDEEYSIGDSYRGIGLAKWELGDYEEAAEALEAALANGGKEDGTIYHLLGACKMQSGEWSEAIEYYDKGLLMGDLSSEVSQEMEFNIIAAYEEQKDWASAKERLDEYTAQYPDDEKAAKEAEFLETRGF